MTSSTAQPSSGLERVLVLLREHQEEWRQRYQLQRIGLFGSTARDQATTTSDVDVWVELDPLIPFATVHLKQELELLLQRPIDLVRLRKRMNPSLRAASFGKASPRELRFTSAANASSAGNGEDQTKGTAALSCSAGATATGP